MGRALCFALGILLTASARGAAAEQNGPAPVHIETPATGNAASDPEREASDRAGDDGDGDDGDGDDAADGDNDDDTAKDDDGRDDKDEMTEDVDTGNPDELDDPAPADHKDDADAAELELGTTAGTRGEGAAFALFHLQRGRFSGALGGGNGGGDQSAQRQWLRGQLGVDVGVALSAAGQWEPEQAGEWQEQLQLSAAGETKRGSWEISLLQEQTQLSAQAAGLSVRSSGLSLSGASAAIDGAHPIGDGVSATAHAGGGIFLLSLPKSAALPWSALAPWDRLGERALAWPARAEGALGLIVEGTAGTASASLGLGLPAESGSLEGALTIAGERAFGRATLSLQLAAAHLWPSDLWQGTLTFGARWRFATG